MGKNKDADDALETESWSCPYGCGAGGTATKGQGVSAAMMHAISCPKNPANEQK